MLSILNFMYNGEVNVNQEDLQNFLAAAEELRIKGLSQVGRTIQIGRKICRFGANIYQGFIISLKI